MQADRHTDTLIARAVCYPRLCWKRRHQLDSSV